MISPRCAPGRFINKIVESDGLEWLFGEDGSDLPGHPVEPCPYSYPRYVKKFKFNSCIRANLQPNSI